MGKNQNVVEDALFQIKNLEEALHENAKGILHSTMKEEIKQLVKESLNEQDEVDDTDETEDDLAINLDTVNDEGDSDEVAFNDEESDEMPPMPPSDDVDDETIDLTDASDDEVLRVFKAMGDEDGIIVKKEDGMLNLKDGENEYMIQLGESEEDFMSMFKSDDDDEDDFEELDFSKFGSDDDDYEDDDFDFEEKPRRKRHHSKRDDDEVIFELEMNDPYAGTEDPYADQLGEEYEEEAEFKFGPMDEESDDFEKYADFGESFKDEENEGMSMDDKIMEAIKKSIKPKGMGMGNPSKFKYDKKPNMSGGFNEKKKEGPKSVGTGKAKFEYDEEVNMDGYSEKPKGGKKMETKEASRTNSYVNANKTGNRKGSNQNVNRTEIRKRPNSRVNEEVETLREKNEEYRTALDVFRTKLNEVAVFNSNLAYATRLFTEHSTTKQEKINILRRFDSVDNLKESKSLYQTIKNELGSTTNGSENTITESIERNVVKTPSTGSAVNLIESKTYENPQFLRMKDLMTKIK